MKNEFGRIVKNVGEGIFNRTLGRLRNSGASVDSRIINARAKWSGRSDFKDWRVRLQIPNNADTVFNTLLDDNELLAPLLESRGMFWPLTPAVIVQHSANYNALAQTHSNYPFQAYQNSQVDQINIIGEFPVQNQTDAKHWVATVNFLRTVTKMFFGKEKTLKGNPPPIMHLSGYGDHVFNKVPVVINTFNVELKPGIDYISTRQANNPYKDLPPDLNGPDAGEFMNDPFESQTWAPTLSNISVLVTPVYSRESVKNFSLKKFARGELNGSGSNEVGFI